MSYERVRIGKTLVETRQRGFGLTLAQRVVVLGPDQRTATVAQIGWSAVIVRYSDGSTGYHESGRGLLPIADKSEVAERVGTIREALA